MLEGVDRRGGGVLEGDKKACGFKRGAKKVVWYYGCVCGGKEWQ